MKYIIYSDPRIINYDIELIRNIENKLSNNVPISDEETNSLLDYICYKTRCKISNDIINDDFTNKDLKATSIISNYFNDLNVTCHACNTRINIDEDAIDNYFLIVEINTDLYGNNIKVPYLIDVTYRQFFIEEKCNPNYRVIKNGTCIRREHPGYYINPYDVESVAMFLEDGYALCDPDFADIYGNSFFNTKTYKIDTKKIHKNIFQHFDSFIKERKIKLLSKEELSKENILIEPLSNLVKKM